MQVVQPHLTVGGALLDPCLQLQLLNLDGCDDHYLPALQHEVARTALVGYMKLTAGRGSSCLYTVPFN